MTDLSLKIDAFEGPLDLLLALIAKNKINILDIPIAEITQQYVDYLDSMRQLNIEVAAEFVAMAAELMLIKSKMLLPRTKDGEDPRKPLVDALLERKRAAETAAFLKLRADAYFDTFTKEPDEVDFPYEREHAVTLLQDAFARMAERAEEMKLYKTEEKLFTSLKEERFYSVEEKIMYVSGILSRRGDVVFDSLFDSCTSRGEMVATFMALLEMASKQLIDVYVDGSLTYISPII